MTRKTAAWLAVAVRRAPPMKGPIVPPQNVMASNIATRTPRLSRLDTAETYDMTAMMQLTKPPKIPDRKLARTMSETGSDS